MKTIRSFIAKASLTAMTLAAAQANAFDQGSSQYVKNVDMNFIGQAAVINIENKSANKLLSELDLEVKTNNMQFELSGTVECKGTNVGFVAAAAHFGPVYIRDPGINSTSVLYTENSIDVAVVDGITEYTPFVFNVPVNQIDNGHPALRVDALEELNKKLQVHIQGGGKEIDFYKQDQHMVLQRPISLSAICGKENNPNKRSSGYETKDHTIQIEYKGDPALTEVPVLNAQLQGNMPNQVQAGEQPFKLHTAEFMANIPHHFGKCVPDQNPVIRVNYHMSGDEMGEMDFRINSYSNQYADYGVYYEELGVLKNPELAGNNSHFDFQFPLKEMLSQQKYSWMAISDNKTYNHNMVLQIRYRPQLGQMTQWKDVDTAIFKHRCVPQLSGQLGGNQGGIQGYDDNQPKPPVINGTIQAKPLPKPMGIRAPVEVPKPTPEPLPVQPKQSEPEQPLRIRTN